MKILSKSSIFQLTIFALITVLTLLSCKEIHNPRPLPAPTTSTSAHNSVLPPVLSSEEYFTEGTALSKKGEYEKAILYLTNAIELNPRYTQAYYERSKVYFYKGELDRAIADCSKTITLDPMYPEAYYLRGINYMQAKRYEEASFDLNKVVYLESAEMKLYDLKEVIDSVVSPGELVLLGVELSSQQTGICNAGVCAATIGYNITLRVNLFVNTDESRIIVDAINMSPAIDEKSQIKAQRYLSGQGFKNIVVNISSTAPAPSLISCSVNYKLENESSYRQSNRLSSAKQLTTSPSILSPSN